MTYSASLQKSHEERVAYHELSAKRYAEQKERDKAKLRRIQAVNEGKPYVEMVPFAPQKKNQVNEALHAKPSPKQPKRHIFNELDANNMRGFPVSYDPPRCAVCGRYGRVEAHHVVKRSQGGTDGPTIALCGFGNNLKDADGRYYCHGLVEHHMLHFRWASGEGCWEYLITDEPMKYDYALIMDGWRRLGVDHGNMW